MTDAWIRRADPSAHQLRLFLVLAEELHFRNAAARVFMTQPAFSQQIRDLERRLGVRLAERTTRSVELTAAGRELLPAAQAVVNAVSQLRRLAGDRARTAGGRLVLGSLGGEAHMPYTYDIVKTLREKHPGIKVEPRGLDFVTQFSAISNGDVDAAVLRPPVPDGLEQLILASEPRVACVPADDPVAADGAPAATLAQLKERKYIDVPLGADRDWWDYWCVNPRPDGAEVIFGTAASDIEGLLSLVSQGEGIAFLPAAARSLYQRPGVAYVEVTDLPPSAAALVWAPKSRGNPMITALRNAAWEWKLRSQPAGAPLTGTVAFPLSGGER